MAVKQGQLKQNSISFFFPQMQFKLEISKDVNVLVSILHQLENYLLLKSPTRDFKKNTCMDDILKYEITTFKNV